MNDFQKGTSRFSSRSRKRKQNRLLNLLIAIVCVLIIIVGIKIFLGGSNHDLKTSTAPNQDISMNDNDQKKQQKNPATDESTTDSDQNSSLDGSERGNTDQSSGIHSQEDSNASDRETSGHVEGPWKPVGTEQESPHQTNYDSDSLDWKEQVKAIFYGAGIDQNNGTLWWLERDTTDRSVGYVSSKKQPQKFYIVHIQWVDQKGWKPAEVSSEHVDDPHAWLVQKRSG